MLDLKLYCSAVLSSLCGQGTATELVLGSHLHLNTYRSFGVCLVETPKVRSVSQVPPS